MPFYSGFIVWLAAPCTPPLHPVQSPLKYAPAAKEAMRGFISVIVVCLALVLSGSAAHSRSAQPGGAQPIAYGQTVTGELSNQQVEALYSFAAQQGDAITITMDAGEGNLDPLVILVDQSLTNVLAVDNDSGGSGNARLRYIIPASTNYVIRATTVQGTGEIKGKYTLTLTLGNPTPTPSPTANAPLIAPFRPGEIIKGDLSDDVRFHLYSLRAKQGDPIAATLEVPANLQVGLYLYSADFREIRRAELGEPLDVKAPADGLYFLMVARAAASGSGTFILRQGVTSGSSGVSISMNRTVRGTISADNAVKTYSLRGTTGMAIVARMRRLSGDLVPYLYVVAIDSGKTLAQATGTTGVAELSLTLPADGTYAIFATRAGQQSGTTTGDYALIITPPGEASPVPAAFQGYAPIQLGGTASGAIDNTVFAVPYLFAAEAGDVIQATMTVSDGDLSPYLLIQNPNGDTVVESGDSTGKPHAQVQTTIAQSGYYALVATRAGFADGKTAGKYDLLLEALDQDRAARAGEGLSLVAGQTQTGAIGPQIANLYRFDVPTESTINLDVSAAPGVEIVIILADSAFQQIAVNSGSIRGAALPQPGTYFVIVARRGGPNDPSVGSYTVALQGTLQGTVRPVPTIPVTPTAAPVTPTPAAPAASTPASPATSNPTSPDIMPIQYGDTISGTISNQRFLYYYTFQGNAGDVVTLQMTHIPGGKLDPLLYLYAYSNGKPTPLAGNNDVEPGNVDASIVRFTLPQTGLYLIAATRMGAAQGQTEGNFILMLTRDA
ncbi:MAG: PPC domain-containing protein [Anaerolineae bacterium]|nr:PPC domain-containing protein [Anaerolineae bacterium]